jgi:hypothetical protein
VTARLLAFALSVLVSALAVSSSGALAQRALETPVDIPTAWRENQAIIGVPPLLPGYVEERAGALTWSLPEHSFRRESEALRDAFPEAWRAVSKDLGIDVSLPLHIRLALNPEHLRALSPRNAPAPEFAVGVAYPAAGLVLVSLTAEAPATSLDPVAVLTHELSHVALRVAVRGRPLPRWLVEGLAIEHAGENNLRRITTLFAAASNEGLLSIREIDRGFSSTSHQVNVAYAQSADLVRYLRAQSPDPETFRDLLRTIGSDVPFEEALLDIYGFDLSSLERAWLNDLRRRYPRISLEAVMSLGWLTAALLVLAAYRVRLKRKRRRLAEMATREAVEDRLREIATNEAVEDRLREMEAAAKKAHEEDEPTTLH